MIVMKNTIQNIILLLSMQFFFAHSSFAQLDSIYDQSVWRTFIVHKPTTYTTNKNYAVVLNLHGLNSNAAEQEAYSQFDNVADTTGFIIVYPNAVGGSWALANNTDVNFISHLVDTMRNRYSTNSCLFSTGMSMGSFMTYKLACALPQPLTAIGSVAGNMSTLLEATCVIPTGLPMMHFHGTADAVVSYNGAAGIPPVDTLIKWWVKKDNCNSTPIFTAIPNINTTDSSTVEKYYYYGGKNGSEVTFYKILNGGHTWPGGFPVPTLGNTNQDINASALIGSFFQHFCALAVDVNDVEDANSISVFPNPSSNKIRIEFSTDVHNAEINILNVVGEEVYRSKMLSKSMDIDLSKQANGIYFVQVNSEKGRVTKKVVVNK
jgi:polyhydroxybutyrate depolymerase